MDFATFYKDMGPRPTSLHTLERKKNNEGYSPQNCIWATRTVQGRNRRDNFNVTIDGITKCVTEWSLEATVSLSTFRRKALKGEDDMRMFLKSFRATET